MKARRYITKKDIGFTFAMNMRVRRYITKKDIGFTSDGNMKVRRYITKENTDEIVFINKMNLCSYLVHDEYNYLLTGVSA
jgi:hypothetical protein